MRDISYRRHLEQSFLIFQDPELVLEAHELFMLANQRIPGLLAMETQVADGQLQFWYDITGKQTLLDYCIRKPVDYRLLQQLLEAIQKAAWQLPVYLLEEAHLLLSPEYIYLNVSGDTMELLYLPGESGELNSFLRRLMEQLLQYLDHNDVRATELGYSLYQLSLQPGISFSQLRQMGEQSVGGSTESPLIHGEGGRLEETFQEDRWPEPVGIPELEDRSSGGKLSTKLSARLGSGMLRTGLEKVVSHWKPRASEVREEGFRSYVTPEEDVTPVYQTEFLSKAGGTEGRFRYQGTEGQPDLCMDKDSYFIGKLPQEVDGCISMDCVSRVHARVQRQEGCYYIEDMNSTNGTYVNGTQLEYHQKWKLEPGDRVVFGRVEYSFI